jgi:hypothetical protein
MSLAMSKEISTEGEWEIKSVLYEYHKEKQRDFNIF